MLELFIYSTTQSILVGIVTRIVALLNWFGGRLGDSNATTPQTPRQEPTGGAL